ncbi:MAG: peroxiredoxin [Actinomycetota bacterium]|nr:peroxiredoxin [Actinomycetota bacterium]
MATVGDRIPDVEVRVMNAEGRPEAVMTGDLLGTGKVVLIAVPGAFTPGCSRTHLPGYVAQADDLTAKGVQAIACISVNDAWVMDAWSADQGAQGKVLMVADGNGEFAKAMDLVMDGSRSGLGLRSLRYAAVINDGVITSLDVDEPGRIVASTCEVVLGKV